MLPLISAGAGLALQFAGSRSARRRAQEAANAEASRIAGEADNVADDLLIQAQASKDQQALIQDRLALADQAEAQAEQEARGAIGPDVTLAISEDPRQRARRRSTFFKQAPSGVQL